MSYAVIRVFQAQHALQFHILLLTILTTEGTRYSNKPCHLMVRVRDKVRSRVGVLYSPAQYLVWQC